LRFGANLISPPLAIKSNDQGSTSITTLRASQESRPN
jgi:hypothetical protein